MSEQVKKMIDGVTDDEFHFALIKAVYKLLRIVDRFGDADGKRLTMEYLTALVVEQIESDRMTEVTI
ncbi:MAG: hypothetical protein ACI4JV_05200 [Ruminiclostridium sp.]